MSWLGRRRRALRVLTTIVVPALQDDKTRAIKALLAIEKSESAATSRRLARVALNDLEVDRSNG